MRRLCSFLCALTLCAGISADELPLNLLKEASGSLIVLDYSFITAGELPVSYSGRAWIQQPCFRISGNGTDILCDGSAIYVKDEKAKEVYIQSPAAIEQFIKDNMGAVRDFKLTRKEKLPMTEDTTQFRLDVSALDKSWIVTDLR